MLMSSTGCADYSYPKASPYENNQAIATSETDSKIFLSTRVQDVIASTNGLSQQLLVYQEDSVTPTRESKNSLLASLTSSKQVVQQNIDYLEAFTPANSMKTKKENIVNLLKNFHSFLDSLKESIESDDFSAMKTHTQAYDNFMTQLQTISQ